MSNIIEELFYGNLEPQELTTEITPKLKKKLNELVKKEEEFSMLRVVNVLKIFQLSGYHSASLSAYR